MKKLIRPVVMGLLLAVFAASTLLTLRQWQQNAAAETAPFDTGIRPALTDRILTLSTCSGTNYDYRYIVQARLPMMELPP